MTSNIEVKTDSQFSNYISGITFTNNYCSSCVYASYVDDEICNMCNDIFKEFNYMNIKVAKEDDIARGFMYAVYHAYENNYDYIVLLRDVIDSYELNNDIDKLCDMLDVYDVIYLDKNHKKNYVYKSIIRGNLKNVKFSDECHGVYTFDNACNVFGLKTNNKSYNAPDVIWEEAYICHYKFKTIEEFVTNKLIRKFPDGNSKSLNLNSFFENGFNERTNEKVQYALTLIK